MTGASEWAGTMLLRPGVMVLTGDVGATTLHAHHSVQVLTSESRFAIGDAYGNTTTCRAVVVPPNVRHRVVHGAAASTVVHVAPEASAVATLCPDRGDTVDGWVRAGSLFLSGPIGTADLVAGLGGHADETGHPAVRRVRAELPGLLADGPVRLAAVALRVRLSESRLAHLFAAEMGLPFRAYVRWLRMQQAMRLVAAGRSFTEAAHGAGFADSAHLNRVCHSMFGAAPSDFGRLRWVDELP
ncbi:helix-turn-helix transcriptional regulator [Nocardia rhizosphaerae]|uniref:Helix-turn-helix transcriptional regulator n=1 Tax=Nocardia rhizosphaerae TaxID=1691571 RepID=A0ABV8LCM5_9NOCA